MDSSLRYPFRRVGIELMFTAEARLHPHHAPMVYAALAHANGLARSESPFFPDGVMALAPEQCRVRLLANEKLAIGWTQLDQNPEEAAQRASSLLRGLRALSKAPRQRSIPVRGNFRIQSVTDLVAGEPLGADSCPAGIPNVHIRSEVERCFGLRQLTLMFRAPLRMPRPEPDCRPGHAHFDATYFDASVFFARLMSRLRRLGLDLPERHVSPMSIALARTSLVWLDLAYGGADGKTLGGACGDVTIEIRNPAALAPLVLGQYAHVGQNTRFGFGAYRIKELGPDPFLPQRSAPLLELALRSTSLERAAADNDLPSGRARQLASLVRAGRYRIGPHTRIAIPKPAGGSRTLAIPCRDDRALQRAVMELIAPALDAFFESSSLAYRRGLGRVRAARMIRRAFQKGFRHALKADFTKFFDSIEHGLLEARLRAYLCDDELTSLIMGWVREGAPAEGRGVPTGSPISPLLANLFLDQFDEAIAREGALLVRYADDFVILYRAEEEARSVFEAARAAAEALALELNQEKTKPLDIRRGFDFLGFRFERTDRWRAVALEEPQRLEDLGWKQKERTPAVAAQLAPLPGESSAETATEGSVIVLGEAITSIGASRTHLLLDGVEGALRRRVPLASIESIVALGAPTLRSDLLRALARQGFAITCDITSQHHIHLTTPGFEPDPMVALGQVAAWNDQQHRLALARLLVAAKIANHAGLARSLGGADARQTAEALASFRESSHRASSIEMLLGFEGAAAARWYAFFASRLPTWCSFRRRVAPSADDPANILLNLAQSFLHRRVATALRGTGLIPGLGMLHAPRSGHAALASDLQEPFRHLMDRAVLALIPLLTPGDFKPGGDDAEYPVIIAPRAMRQAIATINDTLSVTSRSARADEPATYLQHIIIGARDLRRHFLDRNKPFLPFEHPT